MIARISTKHSGSISFYLVAIVCSQLLITASGLNVYTENSKQQQVDIIKQGVIQGSWDYKAGTGHTCRVPATIIESQDQAQRTITLQNDQADPVTVELSVKQFDQMIMDVKVDSQGEKVLKPGESLSVKVSYGCISRNFLEKESGWDRVGFSIKQNQVNHQAENWQFSLLKICSPPAQNYDPSIFILMGVSIILVAIGAYQSEEPIIVEQQEQTQVVTKSHALFFIFGGSLVLVTMYFLYEFLEIGLLIIIMVSSFSSISLLVNDYLEKGMAKYRIANNQYTLPIIDKATKAGIIAGLIAFGIVITYVITRSWIVSNIIAFCMVMMIFKIVRLPSYMIAFLLLGLAFLYDIFWVFYSDRIFGTSVMASVATKVELPMMFLCPKISLAPVQSCSLIGLGDIVLPGIFVAFCFRYSRKVHRNNDYFITCLGGYILGLAICVFFLTVYHTAQPALLYLSPSTLIPVAIHALIKGEFAGVWQGLKQKDEQNQEQRDEVINRNPLAFSPLEVDDTSNSQTNSAKEKRKKSF